MCDFFSSPEPQQPQVIDLRSPEEKQLATQRATYFSGLMGQPDFGYQSQEASLDPLYDRMTDRYKENVEQSAAERGFEPLRYGPGVSEVARGVQEMGENRAADEIARKQWWQQYVTSGGATAAQPMGRQVYQPPEPGPSPFAGLFGPLLGTIGGMFGGGSGSSYGGSPYGGNRSPYGNQPIGYGSTGGPYVMG